jgi:hypothetical protein
MRLSVYHAIKLGVVLPARRHRTSLACDGPSDRDLRRTVRTLVIIDYVGLVIYWCTIHTSKH